MAKRDVDPMFNEDPNERPTSLKKAVGIAAIILAIGAVGLFVVAVVPHDAAPNKPIPATQFR
jgi:hypothetical protein